MSTHFYKFQESYLTTRICEGVEQICVYAAAVFMVFRHNCSLRKPNSCPCIVCPHMASKIPHPSQINCFHEISFKTTFSSNTTIQYRFGVKRPIQQYEVKRSASDWTEKELWDCKGKKTQNGQVNFSWSLVSLTR